MKKIIFLLLTLSVTVNEAYAQIGSFNFDNNLINIQEGENASYLIDGEIASDEPAYLDEAGEEQIILSPTAGLLFSENLANQTDTTTSIEISFTFTLTDLGSGPALTDLWNCQA